MHGGVDQIAQLFEIDRLLHKIERARFERCDGRIHAAERGDHSHGQQRMIDADVAH